MGKFDKPKPNLNARRFGGPQPGQGKGHSSKGGNSHHRASGGVSHSHGNTKERVREHSPSAKLGVEKFDYLLVVDFEATCEADRPNYPNEIIEFPCVLCVRLRKSCLPCLWLFRSSPLPANSFDSPTFGLPLDFLCFSCLLDLL